MATAAQIAANQENAKKSTGPKTEEGKERSSSNGVAHGLCGAFTIQPWENNDALEGLHATNRCTSAPIIAPSMSC